MVSRKPESEFIQMKTALITGITGQDGSYLAELLLEKGYEVHGVIRRSSTFNTSRIDHLYKDPHEAGNNFHLHYGDITDGVGISNLVREIEPSEIYNLAAQSHVKVSFEIPHYTIMTNTLGLLNILEHVRQFSPSIRIYQASSSEMFGATLSPPPYNERSEFRPQSPYGVSKLASFNLMRNYREGYGLFATTGILFNHESPRRGENFVTRKITMGLASILLKKKNTLTFGNLDAVRDWGHSKDYVEAIYLIMQQTKPDEYVVATGEAHTIKEAIEYTFGLVGLDWKKYILFDKSYLRPNEVPYLEGDSSKIRKLGWKPKYSWQSTLKEMLEEDIKMLGEDPSKFII